MGRENCVDCCARLKKDELALCKKMLRRDNTIHLCLNCLADFLGCAVEDLEIKIMEFREQGCALFL